MRSGAASAAFAHRGACALGDDTTVPILAKGKADTGRAMSAMIVPSAVHHHRKPCSTHRATGRAIIPSGT